MTTKDKARDKRYQKKYGITLAEYNEMIKKQKGVCKLCEKPPKEGGRPLHVDHDHKTGRIRGALCFFCNHRRVGALNEEWARKVYLYLKGAA